MSTCIMSAPVSGKCVPLDAIHSDVYESGEMGNGFAILPTEGIVVAPFDCKVVRVSAYRHCVVLTDSKTDCELMIAVDAPDLSHSEFNLTVKAGETVQEGDTLFTFSVENITSGKGSASIPCIITNYDLMKMPRTTYGDVLRTSTTVFTCNC